jgi:Na+/H+-dicarboxylate symporter
MKLELWHKVTLGLIFGVIFGVVAGDQVSYVKPLGDIFLSLVKMIIIPLIYFSLIAGMTSVSDSKTLGRIGMKATTVFLVTSLIAVLIGMGMAEFLQPGSGIILNFDGLAGASEVKAPLQKLDLQSIIVNIVPTNAIGAMANSEFLQVVFFAIFTGITLNLMGSEGKKIIDFCNLITKMLFKMMNIIINFSPYGAFALTAWVVGTQGMDVLQSLGKLVFAVIVAMAVQYLIFIAMIYFVGRISPMPFIKKSLVYQALAFSTSSSKATLPTTMEVCRDKLGVSRVSTAFVLPLGASINMSGMAIYLGMCAIFMAQVTHTHLDPQQYMMILFTSTLGSIGAAGIPGGSMVMLPMILSSVGLPIEGVALIAGIDRILDMVRTTVNITGDVAITLVVDKSEGNLDMDVYNADI